MGITNAQTGTTIDEIEAGIFRIHTPFADLPGGFSFNQYLVDDDEPLLFHTGPRKLFPLVRDAIASVMPIDRLRWIGFGHFEADECGGLNDLLAAAPAATAMCSAIGAMVSANDFADRPVRALANHETFTTGRRSFEWLATPHLPHGWDAGVLFEHGSRTLFCGDLFTQPGTGDAALVETDILGPSEGFRGALDYFSHGKNLRPLLDGVAATEPRTLACMHGSAWRGDGAALLRALGDCLGI
jgi:flavorubredoxin